MGYSACRACKGSGRHIAKSGKAYDCKVCGGSGVDRNWCETRCERCHGTITYKCDQRAPRFCRDCRNVELTKRCSQTGCDNVIRYKVGWDNIPDYCGRCQSQRKKGSDAKRCSSCGTLIWVPPGKNYTMCQACSERERAKQAAKWKTKRCKHCGTEIKYNVDWDKVPDYCKECNAWQEKTCATPGCSNKVKYKKHWENPPKFCDECKRKPGTAVTRRGSGGKPDHTTYSLKSGLRRSFDHDKGKNVRNDHFSEGELGTSVDRDDDS